MRSLTQKLFAAFLIYLIATPGFAASTPADWQENSSRNDIKENETITDGKDTLDVENGSITKDILKFLSIDNQAIEIDNETSKQTLLERELSTWPYYLLSYDTGTDPQADFFIYLAKIFGLIFILGVTIMLIRFFKLRKLRSELSHH